jgi:peptidoglycan/LPS O-acetylase OafA/YrhL
MMQAAEAVTAISPARPGQHLPGLDGVRGLAILMVMFGHFIVVGKNLESPGAVYRLLQSGYLGVDLFFVLSGFLITGILMDSKTRQPYFRVFYWRRALRIFPLYYGLLAISWLTVVWLTPKDRLLLVGHDAPAWFWCYASNIGMAVKGSWLESPTWVGLGHFWSLAVEEQFYLVWPLLVYVLPVKWLERLCILLVVCSPLVFHPLAQWLGTVGAYTSTLSRLGVLAAGGWLAVLWRRDATWSWLSRSFQPVAIAFGLLLLLERTLLANFSGIESSLMLVFSSALVGLAIHGRGRLSGRFFRSRLLRWFGKYSYGIYVYHHALKPVWIHFLWERAVIPWVGRGWPGTLAYTAVATALSLLLAWLSWRWFEAPLLAYKSRIAFEPPAAGGRG